jgi:Flp pilus assembly pilin Flp
MPTAPTGRRYRDQRGGEILNLIDQLKRRLDGGTEEGQALVEYALIIGSIAIIAIGSLTLLGGNVSAVLNLVASSFPAIP